MYEQLYEDNRQLLHYVARRYVNACRKDRAVSVEDLEQAGFFGLIQAEKTYDPERGPWNTFAAWAIIREIYKALGYHDGKITKAHTCALSLDAPLNADDPDGMTGVEALEDKSLPDIDEGALLDDLQRCVRAAVADLKNDRQRNAIQDCNLGGMTYRAKAAELGVSQERVRQIIQAGHRQLKRDRRLENLYDVELRTPYHHRRGVKSFLTTRTSDTEAAALWHMEHLERVLRGETDGTEPGNEAEPGAGSAAGAGKRGRDTEPSNALGNPAGAAGPGNQAERDRGQALPAAGSAVPARGSDAESSPDQLHDTIKGARI